MNLIRTFGQVGEKRETQGQQYHDWKKRRRNSQVSPGAVTGRLGGVGLNTAEMLPSCIITTLPADSGENKAHPLTIPDHHLSYALVALTGPFPRALVVRGHFKEAAHPK